MAVSDCITSFSKHMFMAFSAVSCLFFMIGALGYTNEKDTMKNIPWILETYESTSGTESIYNSLKAVYFEQTGQRFDFADIDENRYEACGKDGYSAYVLVVIACLSSLCCAFLSGALIKNDLTFGQFIGAALAGLATFMSGISLALFMGNCQSGLKNYSDNHGDVFKQHWGIGGILTAVGMVLMFVVCLTMFLTAKTCSSSGSGSSRGASKIPAGPIDGDMTAV